MLFLPVLWVFYALVLPTAAQEPAEEAARCPATPSTPETPPLPNPFIFVNGQRVRTREDWNCRRNEISNLIQTYSLGRLPSTKPKVEGQLVKEEESGRVFVNVTVTEGEKTVFFAADIVYPKEEEEEEEEETAQGKGPLPAIIAFSRAPYTNIPQIPGVAHVFFNNDAMAQQQGLASRGKGLFYDLYGENHSAGALIAWSWGVSRLIDALEQVQRESNINPRRLGVTGCSRNGRGALVAGAFDTRIALTIPQEPGAGGTSCWRIQDYLMNRGVNTQTARQIVTENVWFARVFDTYVNKVAALPFDNHLLSALIAPRALYSAENGLISWLGPEGSWGCQRAARTVWQALGAVENVGYEQTGGEEGHNHCQFPSSQVAGLTAFVERFLKGEKVETEGYFETQAEFPAYNENAWIQWDTPRLR